MSEIQLGWLVGDCITFVATAGDDGDADTKVWVTTRWAVVIEVTIEGSVSWQGPESGQASDCKLVHPGLVKFVLFPFSFWTVRQSLQNWDLSLICNDALRYLEWGDVTPVVTLGYSCIEMHGKLLLSIVKPKSHICFHCVGDQA